MSHETSPNRGPGIVALVAVAAVAIFGGVLLAQFLPADLLGLRSPGPMSEPQAHHALGHDTGHDTRHDTGHDAGHGTADLPPSADSASQEVGQLWTCGMHPQVIEDEPGQCPICGMNLTPMPGGSPDGDAASSAEGTDEFEAHSSGDVVRIDPAVVQNMNVRTDRVERRDLTRPIRTVGYLDFDQQRMVTVTTKYSGWVEKVHVNYVGEKVRRGQTLFEIYSPELVQTEQELLSALAFARRMEGAPDGTHQRALSTVESARIRLAYWDISQEQISRLEETGEVFRTLEVKAPASGLVMKRMAALEGMAVRPGMELFHIADLSSLWLSVELFENQLAWVQEGTEAEITMAYFPGETFHGVVRFLEPELSETTRTMRAKIAVSNRDGRLRKGMYATVELNPIEVRGAIAVPSQAVLRTGERNVVLEALGEGRFVPREVVLGHEAEGYSQVLSGLEVGAEVVTSAQFLLDSESNLRAAIRKMISERDQNPNADNADNADPAPATVGQDHSGH